MNPVNELALHQAGPARVRQLAAPARRDRQPTRLVRRLVALSLLCLGSGLVAHSLWIPTKARIAQVLLERAWSRTVDATADGAGAGAPGQPAGFRPWSWADTWPVARLELPSAATPRKPLIVLSGDSGQALAFGPGLRGGAPALRSSNLVIGGHRDTHFAALEHVAIGDEIALQTPDGTQRQYRVQHLDIVDHHDTRLLEPLDGVELLTLVTCWPFDAVVPGGPLRYVVQAERI